MAPCLCPDLIMFEILSGNRFLVLCRIADTNDGFDSHMLWYVKQVLDVLLRCVFSVARSEPDLDPATAQADRVGYHLH